MAPPGGLGPALHLHGGRTPASTVTRRFPRVGSGSADYLTGLLDLFNFPWR